MVPLVRVGASNTSLTVPAGNLKLILGISILSFGQTTA